MEIYVAADYIVDDADYFTDSVTTFTYVAANYTVDDADYFIDEVTTVTTNKGDDGAGRHKGVRPIVRVRPKVERDLDDALEIIETIAPARRVKQNKAAAVEAIAAIKAADVPVSFAVPIENIQKALKRLSRNTAKHEGMEIAAMRIASELEAVIAEMERKRKRRQRDEQAIIWLLN